MKESEVFTSTIGKRVKNMKGKGGHSVRKEEVWKKCHSCMKFCWHGRSPCDCPCSDHLKADYPYDKLVKEYGCWNQGERI